LPGVTTYFTVGDFRREPFGAVLQLAPRAESFVSTPTRQRGEAQAHRDTEAQRHRDTEHIV